MYKIMCTVLENGVYVNKEIYDDTSDDESKKLVNPVLEMEDSTAGTLTMTLPITNAGYVGIRRMSSDVTVLKNNEEIWWGRVLSEEMDFWNSKKVTCEGALAFLNDVCQPTHDYTFDYVAAGIFIHNIFDTYNNNVANNRKIYVGTIDDSSAIKDLPTERYGTNFEPTIDWVRKVADELKLHLNIRKEGSFFYIDFIKGYLSTINQTINFGKNLLDFTRKWSNTNFATVVIPLGGKINLTEHHDLDVRLTIEGYGQTEHHEAGSIYITSSAETIAQYGRIEKVVTFDDYVDPDPQHSDIGDLYGRGLNYLEDTQYDNVELEVTAIDLSYLNVSYESMKMLHQVHVVSAPHTMDRYFPITKMSIPLDEPENTKFILGKTDIVPLTNSNGRIEQIVRDQIKNIPDTRSIIEAAKERASEVMNRLTVGYVTLHEAEDENGNPLGYVDAIYISDVPDINSELNPPTHLWKWDMNGFGYAKNKRYNEETGKYEWVWDVAINMKGQIVADFISTGHLNADLLTTGTIRGRDLFLYQNLIDEHGDLVGTNGGNIEFWGDAEEVDEFGNIVPVVDEYGNPVQNQYGLIRFDNDGGGQNVSKRRIYWITNPGVAVKVYSGAGISLTASGGGAYIYAEGGNGQIYVSGSHSEEVTEQVDDGNGNYYTITQTKSVPNNVEIESRDGTINLRSHDGKAYLNGYEILTRNDVPDVIAKFG